MENKKKTTNLVLAIVLPVLLLVTLLMGLAVGLKPSEGDATIKWFDLAFGKGEMGDYKVPGLVAVLSFLIIAIALAMFKIALSVEPLANKKWAQITNKVIGIALIVIIVLAAVMALCTKQLFIQEVKVQAKKDNIPSEYIDKIVKELKDNLKLGVGSILMGVFGLLSAGIAATSVALNCNKKAAKAA